MLLSYRSNRDGSSRESSVRGRGLTAPHEDKMVHSSQAEQKQGLEPRKTRRRYAETTEKS